MDLDKGLDPDFLGLLYEIAKKVDVISSARNNVAGIMYALEKD